MMMMIMRHPVALFICAVIGFMIHKTQSDDELELFCAIAANSLQLKPLFYVRLGSKTETQN